MKRILLLHVSVGMGHLRAAQALARALEQQPDTAAIVEDTLELAHPAFRRAYAGLYLGISHTIPAFWSSFYAQTDQPSRVLAATRALSTRVGVRGLGALLERTRPDAIVCTHFLPLEALAQLHQPLPPVTCVVTDYHAHQFWVCPGVDRYVVPTAATRQQLLAAGVAPARVQVSGIPIDPALSTPADQHAARQQLELPCDRPVVAVIGSGLTATRVRAIAEALRAQPGSATIVVATGRNHTLAEQIGDLARNSGTMLRVLGPQPSLDPLIVASDVVVSKAGGLTSSEVLARGVPLLMPLPVPGQEQWNAEYVISAGAGIGAESATEIASASAALLADPARRAAMSAAARAIANPAAAQTIAAAVLADIAQRAAGYRPRRVSHGARWWNYGLSH